MAVQGAEGHVISSKVKRKEKGVKIGMCCKIYSLIVLFLPSAALDVSVGRWQTATSLDDFVLVAA